MIDSNTIIGFFLTSAVIGTVLFRLRRGASATLVIQEFHLAKQPSPSMPPTVEIVGRMQGIVAFVLSLLKFSPITRLTLAGMELRCESGSLAGRRMQVIPIRQVSNLAAGIHKPIGNLISALVLNIVGVYGSVEFRSILPIIVTLVAGLVLVGFYAVSKKFFVEIHAQGGPPISLLFKPNVLEGVPIDAHQAMSVIGVIRDLVIAANQGTAGAFDAGATGVVATPLSPKSSADESPLFPSDLFQTATKQVDENEPLEVLLEVDEPDLSSAEEIETQADALLAESKQVAANGNRRKAVQLLKSVVTRFPSSKAAQQARRTLERSGIQV